MKKYLFLDDEHVELDAHVERIFHEPVKHGRPVLAPETKLEGNAVQLWNAPLLSDNGRSWRLWYRGAGNSSFPVLYAESEDGLHWRRRNLKLVKYGGSRNNNIVATGLRVNGHHNNIVLTANPVWDGVSDRRFCALTFDPKYDGKATSPYGLISLASRDGFRWRVLSDHPLIPSSDEYQLACDKDRGLLIATMKLYGHMNIPFSVSEHGRQVGLATSTDGGATWSEAEFIYHADSADREAGVEALARHAANLDLRSPLHSNPEHSWTDVYNMPVLPYHGVYIGLPTMFHHSGYWIADKYSANQDGIAWPALTWSKDLKHWKRPLPRKPFLPLSPCTDNDILDNGGIYHCQPVPRDGELWIYYTGCRGTHVPLPKNSGLDYFQQKEQNAIFLARLRLDGFASLRAGDRRGAVLTKPIAVEGPNLRINVRTRNGEILAEIRDAESGRVIPGFGLGDYLGARTIHFGKDGARTRLAGLGTRRHDEQAQNDAVAFSGDKVDAVMTWRGRQDLSALKGKPVRVLFALRNAELYSFWFQDEQPEKPK